MPRIVDLSRVEEHRNGSSVGTAPRRGALARWTARLRGIVARHDRPPATDDPITPEMERLVRRAFPREIASEALETRVATIYQPAETATAGARSVPPVRGRTRNGLFGDGCSARLRWGSVGALATLAFALWLTLPRGDVLAAAIRATASVPVIHVTWTGDAEGEFWLKPDTGLYLHFRDKRSGEMVVLDDGKRWYQYDVTRKYATAWPSKLGRSSVFSDYVLGVTGAGMMQLIQRAQGVTRSEPVEVRENGTLLRRVTVTHRGGARAIVDIDAKSDRIQKVEATDRRGGEDLRYVAQFDYPDPATVDRGRFVFKAPPGVTVQDYTKR